VHRLIDDVTHEMSLGMSLYRELKRRNVFRVAAAYVVTAWLVIQVVETILPAFGFTDAAIRFVVIAFAVGLVPVLILSWAFEFTPEGLKKEADVDRSATVTPGTGKQLDRAIMGVLALALGYFALDKFALTPRREARDLAAAALEARDEGHSEALVESYGDKSIAVLPFVDMSSDKDQQYMADGIAEELLNLLARIQGLRVISRTSAFSFKGKDIEIPVLARQLDVNYVLEGSVRKAGNQLRITAQLIDARSDTHVWSETYDHAMDDVFEMQDEIAASVVKMLKIRLLGTTPKTRRVDRDAYALILQARYFWNRRAQGDEEKAMEYYRRALDIDPSYAPAWTGLSVAIAVQALDGRLPRDAGLAKAREAAQKALALDPASSDAHVRMGQAYIRAYDQQAASREFQQALDLDPNSALAMASMAEYVSWRNGRTNEAIALLKKAASLDPLSAIAQGNLGAYLLQLGRLNEAQEATLKALELSPDSNYRENLAQIFFARHQYDKALALAESLEDTATRSFLLTVIYHAMGRQDDSDAALARLAQSPARRVPFLIAEAHASRGEADQAFEWIEKTRQIGVWRMDEFVFEPFFKNLHGDPRWDALLGTLKWAP
jgi:adenylate cyclase